MVQIHSISICKDVSDIFWSKNNLKCLVVASHIPPPSWKMYFYRNSIIEFTMFISKFVTVRTPKGMKQQIDQDHLVAYVTKDATSLGLSCVIVTDKEYPSRVAFDLTERALERVMKRIQERSLGSIIAVSKTDNFLQKELEPILMELFESYQDPVAKDKILKAKESISQLTEATKLSIERLLNEGEKIDQLIAESADLSQEAKRFYAQSRNSSCCTIL